MQYENKTKQELISELSQLRRRIAHLEDDGDGDKQVHFPATAEWYQLIAEESYSGIYILQDGEFKWVNRSLADIAGYTREEFLSIDFLSLIHPDYQDIVGRATEQALTGDISGLPSELDIQVFRKGGEARWIRIMPSLGTYDGRPAIVGNVIDITDYKNTELELERKSAHLNSIFQYSKEAMATVDLDNSILEVNRAFEKAFGYTLDEIKGICLDDLIVPERLYHTEAKELDERALAAFHDYETVRKRKGGTEIDVSISAGPLKVGEEITGRFVVLHDITERKRAEQALQESENKYRHLAEDLRDIIVIEDMNLTPTYVSSSAEGLFGYSVEELMHMEKHQYMTPDSFKNAMTNFEKYVHMAQEDPNFNEPPLMENEYVRKDGSTFWGELKVKFLRDSEGNLVGSQGMLRDITERKRAKDALQESEEKYRDLVERANDGICIIQDGIFEFVNSHLAEMLGNTTQEILNQPFVGYIHPDSLAQVEKYYRRRMAGEDIPSIYKTVLLRKDGSKLDAELNAGVITYNGRPADLVFVRDISARKRAEQKLEQTKSELERSNKELEHFAYIVSHDLQEPLRMVSSYMKLVEKRYKDLLDDDGREFIYYAADGSRRMQDLLNDLLTYCRVNTHGHQFQPVNCDAVLNSVVGMLNMAIRDAQATITWDSMPQVVADESQLVQLFQNLISNAIKYRRDEPPLIHVSVEKRNNEWLFSVQDNGMGIDPESKDRAFLIFQRLHREKCDGTGVGLAVCKKIMDRHGGQIWLESEPGQGTTFYFTIPKRVEDT